MSEATKVAARPQSAAEGTSEPVTLQEVERLFVKEAALLDNWQLDEWLERFITDDGSYIIPSLDTPDAVVGEAIHLAADDIVRLRSRVGQYRSNTVWAENPRSRTRRLVTNFDILGRDGDETTVTANFAIWRFDMDNTDVYVGRYVHKVVRGPDGQLKIHERKSILDLETLRPHGRISFIL